MNARSDVNSDVQFLFKETLKMKRKSMKAGNRKRTQKNSSAQWLYPLSVENEYIKYNFALMDVFARQALPAIKNNIESWTEERDRLDVFHGDDFQTEFQKLIDDLRSTQSAMFDPESFGITDDKNNFFSYASITAALLSFGNRTSKFNQRQFQKFVKPILGTEFLPDEPQTPILIDTWVQSNFDLIKSLSDEYIKKVNVIVTEGWLDKKTSSEIMKELREMSSNMTRSRARLIARDQIGKLNGRLTRKRNEEAGLMLYKWLTAGDERVRPSHKKLSDKICKWGDNTVYADSVEDAIAGKWKSRNSVGMYVGIPGQDIQCRCTSSPVVSEILREVDEELEKAA